MNTRALPLLALVIAIAAFFGYVNPMWSGSIAETKAAIAEADEGLAAAEQYAAQQDELANARNAIDPADLARLNTFLPSSVDNVGLILDLNALAAKSGLSLSNIDVSITSPEANKSGTPATTNPIGSVDLSLSAVGTYGALQAFLQGVEHSERLLDVRDLFVRGSETGVYNYQMTIRLYWLR